MAAVTLFQACDKGDPSLLLAHCQHGMDATSGGRDASMEVYMTNRFFVLISILGVAACGGGGGGGDTFETPEDDVRTLTGSSAPLETTGDQSARAASILSGSDSLIFSTAYGNTTLPDVPSFQIIANCSGTRCVLREPQSGVYTVITPDDLRFVPAENVIALSKHGITLFGGETDTGRGYGSWIFQRPTPV